MDILVDQIKNQIKVAFTGVAYPGDNDLTVHPLGLDEIFYDSIRGKKWQDLPAELLSYHHDCIGVLTPKGFQYFVAAFLIEGVELDSVIAEQMICLFSDAIVENSSPIKGVTGKEWFDQRVSILSLEQLEAIRSYFVYISDNDEEEFGRLEYVLMAIDEELDRKQLN